MNPIIVIAKTLFKATARTWSVINHNDRIMYFRHAFELICIELSIDPLHNSMKKNQVFFIKFQTLQQRPTTKTYKFATINFLFKLQLWHLIIHKEME